MTSQERSHSLIELLAKGLEMPATERPSFIERACGADEALRVELTELLEIAADQAADFLAEPAVSRSEVLALLLRNRGVDSGADDH